MRPFFGAILVVLLGLPALPSAAGIIHGKLSVPVRNDAGRVAPNPYPGRASSLPGGHASTRGAAHDGVLYVEKVPARAESALAAARRPVPQLAQKDQAFQPRVLAVAVGTKVQFPNQDPIYHNVFSLSPARRFDLGKYPRGDSREVVFSKPGLVNVYCDIHSGMEAFVLVLPNHAFARPDPAGSFELPALPAGRYLLRAWHPDLGERRVTVDVPATGRVVADVEY